MRSQAVLIAIGINWEGRRNILAVELASRESLSSWKELLAGLRQRSLHGVEVVVSDDHAGLRRAILEALPEAVWRNAAMFTFCAMRSIICRAKPMMIACRSCAGSMIGGTLKKRGRIFRPGS